MRINAFNEPSYNVDYQNATDKNKYGSLDKDLEKIDQAQKELMEIDKQVAATDKQPSNPEVMGMIATHQSQVVKSMLEGNLEEAIALLLAKSIETYAKRLQEIQDSTGGKAAFSNALQIMFDSLIQKGTPSRHDLENIFQLAIMDFMSNEYEDLTPVLKEAMSHFLESTGSGSHGVHEGWNGPHFANNVDKLFDFMLKHAPEDSLCRKALKTINKDSLKLQLKNNFENEGGFVGNDKYDTNPSHGLSPMLRIAITAAYLKYNPLELKDVELLLTGSMADLNAYINSNTEYSSAMEYLFANDDSGPGEGWRMVVENKGESTERKVIDWEGVGLSVKYFEGIYNHFPQRILTEDELKEVNRIGDQVKMLQETLKYWLSIMRDERLSTLRNI
ncbi:hypothetical protein NPV54_000788 [Vibrio cholerae]|uniref:hypothetical protein n=1 Tax=Vibrio cholerae TaxID=666 RepID=UPI000E0A7CEB|nr:hypothetical protein [Vibrio cholerae]EGQ7639663.1 hypothetical protein [Vibrio cholerae]EHE6949017.1 hypothetical protein [Vibrio cholerae]EJN3161487.1 hypothetical protein [Vibrio cholerae]ELD8765294.1 hypothetical protein [Vibrio cholerae]ELJ8534740.1 hypothetical protein [Vibrio cholerae]